MQLCFKKYSCRIQESSKAAVRNVYVATCQMAIANELREIWYTWKWVTDTPVGLYQVIRHTYGRD